MLAEPPGVVRLRLPLAPLPTNTTICVAFTLTIFAAAPPKLTALAPKKFAPAIVTVSPCAALVGVKLLMRGAGINTNPDNVPVPATDTTVTSPEAPEADTRAEMSVSPVRVNDAAAIPPKRTAVAPVKPVPRMSTVPPAGALVGEKLAMAGGAARKVNPASVPVPLGEVTVTAPDALPAATTAVMRVAELRTNDVAATPPKLTAVAPVK